MDTDGELLAKLLERLWDGKLTAGGRLEVVYLGGGTHLDAVQVVVTRLDGERIGWHLSRKVLGRGDPRRRGVIQALAG